jgi:starch synthase (maltosyl-transferring)
VARPAAGKNKGKNKERSVADPSSAPLESRAMAASVLVNLGNDRWAGALIPRSIGSFDLVVEAWTDRHATWAHKVEAKLAAGQGLADLEVDIQEGLLLLESNSDPLVASAAVALKDDSLDLADRLGPALTDEVGAALWGPVGAADRTTHISELWVDRPRASTGAWYELFPRSFGGLRGTAEVVPELAALGFDVLYLPPVHPIGTSHRKGKNNTLEAGPDDPGSPWAIGSAEGGHTDIAADLGTFEDFDHLVRTLSDQGMEIALDYALQCSPDHPWVREHPEWFHHRPDGTIAYAENPPKKYQDIYPINFWPDRDPDRVALWQACLAILEFWISKGVRIFRVDNPHTKPIAFWEWIIPQVHDRWPDTLFLAEAFTRPAMMAKLAEVGFSQSYTYFTWRITQHGPEGLWAYLEELAHGDLADFMRPNFWPNTPDILSGPLRAGPPAAFALRYVLAATLTPSYGVYSGYENYENQPASPTNEEYLNSEKYEIRRRELVPGAGLLPLMSAVNRIRRRHPAFSQLRTLHFHRSDNPAVIAYSKTSDDGADVVLVVVNLNPSEALYATVHLDLDELGIGPNAAFEVRDELSGETYTWAGAEALVILAPEVRVAHIFHVDSSVIPSPPVLPA